MEQTEQAPEGGAGEAIFAELGLSLAETVADATPTWVRNSVRRYVEEPWPEDLTETVATEGEQAAKSVRRALGELLALDIDAQWTNPLTVIRGAVRFPGQILADLGVPEPDRDDHDKRFNPDDMYDLGPATFADLGDAVADVGLRWGAAKAHLHIRRRRERLV